jgi:hypothetical protein
LSSSSSTPSCIVLVSGSRTFTDSKRFADEFKHFQAQLPSPIQKLVVGDCRGADSLAVQYAQKHQIPYQIYQANWETEGKTAGPHRNRRMVDEEHPTHGLFFMSSTSKGTRQCYEYAQQHHVHCTMIAID